MASFALCQEESEEEEGAEQETSVQPFVGSETSPIIIISSESESEGESGEEEREASGLFLGLH